MDNEALLDIADAIRRKNIPEVDLLSTQNALWRIAGLLEDVHTILPLLDGIEDRLCEIRDELSTLSAIQESKG
ncbi:MAG: hypothetical protein EBY40_07115 [Marivivens sp.]|nr:hypothetical protein [Marivivens sp.]NBT52837.1 hypothetical protein [Marivivens sp.]NCW69559.1 hypothetical protein [Marivivens sp.]NDH02883.1 hypothetical protein [Marivivens sp.]